MLFKFKKPEIVLDCFTTNSTQYEIAKINYGKNFYPEWFKRTPQVGSDGSPTIKYCQGLTDFYKNAIVIPSWFTAQIVIHPDKTLNFEENFIEVNFSLQGPNRIDHPSAQYSKFKTNNSKNFKIHNDWIFKTKEKVQFVWSQPTWHKSDILSNLHLLPAVIDFKYQHGTNISWMVSSHGVYKEFYIEPLDPLVVLHPMDNRKVVIKNHLVDIPEYHRVGASTVATSTHFLKPGNPKYNRQLNERIIDKVEKLQCPVHSTDHTKR